MRHLSIDIETYSEADIKKTGAYRYVDDPSFEIILIAYQFEEDKDLGLEPEIIDLMQDSYTDFIEERTEEYGRPLQEARLGALPIELAEALQDPEVVKHAYNANFERTALAKWFGVPMPPEQWECTMIHAATLGLPGSLGKVGEVLGFAEDKAKDKEGKALIQYFCKPCKPTKTNGQRTRNLPEHAPEKWEKFKSYCQQDVVAEMAIADKLAKWKPTEKEHDLWCLDQAINDRGVKLDLPFIDGIVEFDAKHREELLKEAQKLTNLDNPNSNAQLIAWLQTQGITTNSVAKDTVTQLLNNTDNPIVKRVLEIKQELGKTSTKKYITMQDCICSDGRLHGSLQFYGANRTGRWAGRLVQVHNLPQNHIDDIELCREVVAEQDFETAEMLWGQMPFILSQLIRTAFVAKEGHRFIVSDFSAIEARVLAWLSGEQWRIDVFNTHGKIYEASASQMFHIPIENIKKGSKLRQQGKIAELALGYGGGDGAIKVMDKDESIPDNEIPLLVSNWRKANPHIVKFWGMVEAAAKTAIKERREIKTQWLIFSYENNVLFIKLPSGRRIAYWDAHIGDNRKGMESILYGGVDQTTKQWINDVETYGGKLTENIVQAVARDCLAMAMMRVAQAGNDIVMHVHDEMIIEAPPSVTNEEITNIMGLSIEWAPGLPLRGDTYDTPFYKKD